MKNNELKKGEIVIYQTPDKKVEVRVALDRETVWATLNQIADLFSTDKSGISRHIKNIYESGELAEKATVAKIATVQREGKRQITREIEYYNLDMILSVGYRVNSQKATQFRVWATNTLKNYLIKGYAINEKKLLETKEKLAELGQAIAFLREKSKHELLSGQGQEILDLLANYSKTLTLLEEYDKGKLKIPSGKKGVFSLNYDSAKKVVGELKKELLERREAGDLFGQEYDSKLESIIKNLYCKR